MGFSRRFVGRSFHLFPLADLATGSCGHRKQTATDVTDLTTSGSREVREFLPIRLSERNENLLHSASQIGKEYTVRHVFYFSS